MTEEEKRLQAATKHTEDWKKWGPYLAERAWGTVREDYSPDGAAWDYFPHDQARAKAYRWNEDGLLGICDRRQYLCFALALWNGKDFILKERLFGLTNKQGNHGEDGKEIYYFLDSTPTHSYMKALYKYPQAEYPYTQLVEENGRRSKRDPEYELYDTGVFNENRYFDVFVEYAKANPENTLIAITVVNRGPEAALLHLLPTLWFRNTWAWGEHTAVPSLKRADPNQTGAKSDDPNANASLPENAMVIQATHPVLEPHWLFCEQRDAAVGPQLLFTNNETNFIYCYGPKCQNTSPYVKDGINNYVVNGDAQAVNPDETGTKMAALYKLTLQPGESQTIRLRLTPDPVPTDPLGEEFEAIFAARKRDSDEFYATVVPAELSDDAKDVQRQAFAGLLWSKQYYNYAVEQWLDGDPGFPKPPNQRESGRNTDWRHLYNADVLPMPDTWEYPWYAAWDTAFHCLTLALIDPAYAKRVLILLCREWFMHPNGQLPAYEWAFGDVNPPVHAWAALRVYKIERKRTGKADHNFLERVFHKLLLNFTWWVNRKDPEGRNVFQGGFLGLDNIGVFDRSAPLPNGERLEQSDGTAWMGHFSLSMLAIALELSREDPVYEDVATKFFEHFLYIAGALNNIAGEGVSLWDEEDQFFYDVLRLPDKSAIPLKVRSLVGLIPLMAVETIEQSDLDRLPGFTDRMNWFLNNRPDLASLVTHLTVPGKSDRRLLALVRMHRMDALMKRMLDPEEFFSDHGIRSVSRFHKSHPYMLYIDGQVRMVEYAPAESRNDAFGGNSNWRGPIWFPLNYLLIEGLQRFHYYYGDDVKVECPTGSGTMLNLWQVAEEMSKRLTRLFLKDANGQRPCHGGNALFADPNWNHPLFYEYFHGDTGQGLGASHQTGWTALVAKLIQQNGE